MKEFTLMGQSEKPQINPRKQPIGGKEEGKEHVRASECKRPYGEDGNCKHDNSLYENKYGQLKGPIALSKLAHQ